MGRPKQRQVQHCLLNRHRQVSAEYSGRVYPGSGSGRTFGQRGTKIAKKGFAYLLRHFWRGLPRWTEVTQKIGHEPKATSFRKREEFEKAESDYMHHFMETPQFQREYLDKVADGLIHAKESGNSYSA